jgi:hypothetical protein
VHALATVAVEIAVARTLLTLAAHFDLLDDADRLTIAVTRRLQEDRTLLRVLRHAQRSGQRVQRADGHGYTLALLRDPPRHVHVRRIGLGDDLGRLADQSRALLAFKLEVDAPELVLPQNVRLVAVLNQTQRKHLFCRGLVEIVERDAPRCVERLGTIAIRQLP